jgi:hypothetical protein
MTSDMTTKDIAYDYKTQSTKSSKNCAATATARSSPAGLALA